MSAGLYRLLWRRFGGIGPSFGARAAKPILPWKSAFIGLTVFAILLVGAAVWLVMSVDDSESADSTVTQLTGDNSADDSSVATAMSSDPRPASPAGQGQPAPASQSQASITPAVPAIDDKPTGAVEPSLDGLRISSQSWRRGGLGSKALVTFTLRNSNLYAVKDVEISCAFSRRDGSHLTDRSRLVPGEVDKKSRKTFAAVHVGFVNVNASKANCTLVSASKN
ncbi:hypothetical protein ACQR1W_17160 [Bradyrhizobium sp. HKCCYLS1011]|uniref:hypothetical protein n=1 Tax=Bradyrhizobium sp. HKCCYLS1011 TaxID=3420733 RepID=UPI003EBFD151